ncbi:MAG: DUF255 domain-containing protein [Sulfurospirillaceae bacterium]|nr:DUF255 domain-containing protein [Sulfurospirillaceae bacterium]MDD2827679.1 DUF255 domain-containing protein [Sulfurospirillaceae bacterium]
MRNVIIFCFLFSFLFSASFETARNEAKKSNKMILVELVMESCTYCEKMDKYVLPNEEVKQVLNDHYIFIKLDINKDEIPDILISRITPTFYFLNTSGEKIIQDIIGAPSKSQFLFYLKTQYQNLEK